jgi:hypothetical protein
VGEKVIGNNRQKDVEKNQGMIAPFNSPHFCVICLDKEGLESLHKVWRHPKIFDEFTDDSGQYERSHRF